MDRLLVFGRTGQVARELAKLAPQARFVGRDEADLRDPVACADQIQSLQPQAVINAAAYTAVDRAESEPQVAKIINTEVPGTMARCCARLGIPFVHISTDYVFDGGGTVPRNETAEVRPINAYGATKLGGERAIAAAGGQWATLRTSWVFSAHGSNFVLTMLRVGSTRPQVRIVADQIGGPTAASAVAAATLKMARSMMGDPKKGGLYHFSGAPDVSWAEFAREIFRLSKLAPDVVEIATVDYPTPAKRPLNSRLDCEALQRDFGIARPDWRADLQQVLREVQSRSMALESGDVRSQPLR